MTHDGLQSLRRPSQVLDEQRRSGVAEHVEAVPVNAVRDETAFDLQRVPGVPVDTPHALDLPPVIREHEIEIALGANDAPLLERIEDNRSERNIALSRFDRVVTGKNNEVAPSAKLITAVTDKPMEILELTQKQAVPVGGGGAKAK
jgi:hypothetical protein